MCIRDSTMFYPHFAEGWFAFKLFADESEQPYIASVAHIAGNVYTEQCNCIPLHIYSYGKVT